MKINLIKSRILNATPNQEKVEKLTNNELQGKDFHIVEDCKTFDIDNYSANAKRFLEECRLEPRGDASIRKILVKNI